MKIVIIGGGANGTRLRRGCPDWTSPRPSWSSSKTPCGSFANWACRTTSARYFDRDALLLETPTAFATPSTWPFVSATTYCPSIVPPTL